MSTNIKMINKTKTNGDCYATHGNFVMDESSDYTLCHGVARIRTDGTPYGHCWIESGGVAIDKSNGVNVELPIELYYALGNIPVDGYKIYKYKRKEVIEKILEYGHWGPWDYKPPR